MVMLLLMIGILSSICSIALAGEDEPAALLACIIAAVACLLPPAMIDGKKVEHVSIITNRLELRDVSIVTDTPKVFSYDKTNYSHFSYKWLTVPSGGRISDIKVEDYNDKSAK